MANTPPLSKADKSNFATLQRADRAGDLALMSAIRLVDRKPVALVCAVGHDGVTFAFTPLAVMVEGNPFEDFEPSLSDDPQPPPQQFEPYAPYTIRPYEGKKWLIHGPTLPEMGWTCPSEAEAKSRAALLRDAWGGGIRWTTAASKPDPLEPLALAVREAEEHEIRMARMWRGWRSQPGGPDQAEVREAWAEASRATDAARNALATARKAAT